MSEIDSDNDGFIDFHEFADFHRRESDNGDENTIGAFFPHQHLHFTACLKNFHRDLREIFKKNPENFYPFLTLKQRAKRTTNQWLKKTILMPNFQTPAIPFSINSKSTPMRCH
ncbi:hypothetical protein ACSBR1_029017 [Camellia fascicularis]